MRRAGDDLRLDRAAGHRRQNHHGVGVLDGGVQPFENAHVLVVQVDVDVAIEVAVGAEDLTRRVRVALDDAAENVTDVASGCADFFFAVGRGAKDGRNLYGGHRGGD